VQGLKPKRGCEGLPDDEFAGNGSETGKGSGAGTRDTGLPTEETEGRQLPAEGRWLLFEFEKLGRARFLSHINIMTIFERSFQRAGILLEYSKGYNPKPRLEFAHPLTLGIESTAEICRAKIIPMSMDSGDDTAFDADHVRTMLQEVFPDGLRVTRVGEIVPDFARGKGKSLMSLFAGSIFSIAPADDELMGNIEGLEADFGAGFEAIGEVDGETSEGQDAMSAEMSVEVQTGGSGPGGKALKNLMSYYGGPGPFLSRYRVRRIGLYAVPPKREEPESEEKVDYFTRFVSM
jgi:radical SAM-linked protein